jgi:hypothetical protein
MHCLREAQRLRRALEKKNADLSPQVANLSAQPGLRDMEPYAGARDVFQFGHRDELAEMTQFHFDPRGILIDATNAHMDPKPDTSLAEVTRSRAASKGRTSSEIVAEMAVGARLVKSISKCRWNG